MRWNKYKHVHFWCETNINMYTFDVKQIQTFTLLIWNKYKHVRFWCETNINMYTFDVKQIQTCTLLRWKKYKHIFFGVHWNGGIRNPNLNSNEDEFNLIYSRLTVYLFCHSPQVNPKSSLYRLSHQFAHSLQDLKNINN